MDKVPTVAVVESSAGLRLGLSGLLKLMGIPCRTFSQARSFLAEHTSGEFACLITDVRSFDMDRFELIGRLRAQDPSVPVIVITSMADQDVRRQALNQGVQAYLTHPFNDDVLMHHLRAMLSRSAPRESQDASPILQLAPIIRAGSLPSSSLLQNAKLSKLGHPSPLKRSSPLDVRIA